MAGLRTLPHDRSTPKVLRRAGRRRTGGHRKATLWRQVFPAMMSASDLHTQPPSPPGPGWEPAPASYTHRWQREEMLRVAARRGPAPLGTGTPAGPRRPRGAPRNRCASDSRRGMQPAGVIQSFQRCRGPAGEGGGGGRQPRGRIQPPAPPGRGSSRRAAPPPRPTPRRARTERRLTAPSPSARLPRPSPPRSSVPFPAGGPCSRSGRRWGR